MSDQVLDYGLDMSDVDRDLALPDLVAEGDALDALVSAQADWPVGTPAAGAARPRSQLLEQWRAGRAEVAAALRNIPLDQAFPWYGSELTALLMVPLRLMETWAHGQDVFDALGVEHPPTSRLRHVATLGVVGRALSFYAARLPVPAEPFRVELTSPDDQIWAWGPEDAEQRVRGSALDFCLRVTQRRSRAETTLTAVGADAETWLDNARVFL